MICDKEVSRSALWLAGLHLDTADTFSIDHGDLDVTLVTPGFAPGVLHEPVVLAVVSSITNAENTVVKLGSALGGVKDATLVELEDSLVGLDGN